MFMFLIFKNMPLQILLKNVCLFKFKFMFIFVTNKWAAATNTQQHNKNTHNRDLTSCFRFVFHISSTPRNAVPQVFAIGFGYGYGV